MQFNQGAGVFTTDGKEAGHIDRVVIDPKTNDITHIVIRKGFLFTKDKVVPIDAIAVEQGGQLALRMALDQLEHLPDFEEKHYVMVDEGKGSATPSAVFSYPPYPGGTPVIASSGPKYVTETHLNIPNDTIAVKEGAKVVTRDGEDVGHVEQVLTGVQADHVTHFLISKGLLVKEKRLIPVGWIDQLDAEEVHLAVKSDTVNKLPIVEPA